MRKDNFSSVLTIFTEALLVPIEHSVLKGELKKHPDYNSLLAYNDVLAYYGINTSAYKINVNDIADISLPAIAHLSNRRYAVIKEVHTDHIVLADEKKRHKKVTTAEFAGLFTGAVLVSEDVTTNLNNYNIKSKKLPMHVIQKYAAIMLGIVIIYLFILNSSFLKEITWAISILVTIKLAGVFITSLLLAQSINSNNSFVARLCGDNDKIDCGEILASDAAKITSYLNWSEVGFFYFTGSLSFLIFDSNKQMTLQLLALINVFALPYTIFSIYYQWKIAQKWCVLCCSVQVLLWAEFCAFLPYLSFNLSYYFTSNVIYLLIFFTIPIALWILIKPTLERLVSLPAIEEQLRAIKFNRQTFNAALKFSLPIENPKEYFSIVLGNKNPKHIITIVLSPFCRPCAKAFQQIENAIDTNRTLQLRIIFAGIDIESNNDKMRMIRHVMLLNRDKDRDLIKIVLADWYGRFNRDYNKLAEMYPVTNTEVVNELIILQKEWAKINEIKETPTILIDGHKMPLIYQLHELKYMLD